MNESINPQDFQESIELVSSVSFQAGLFIGVIIGLLFIELSRSYILPYLEMFLHTERLKRGITCNCDHCETQRYLEKTYS